MVEKRRPKTKTATKVAEATKSPLPKRRKHARPAEIIKAALQVFSEQGFGAAKMENIARLASVAKGTLFVYFPNKEALFRAAVKKIMTDDLSKLRGVAADQAMPLQKMLPLLLTQIAAIGEHGLPPIARLIIVESRAFPDLARMWHEEVVTKVMGVLTRTIKRAQKRGEMPAGDPKLYVFSIVGPMLSSMLFREVFKGIDGSLPDLRKLASQHAKLIVDGVNAAHS
jgi:AcrR family transcriptional regulator